MEGTARTAADKAGATYQQASACWWGVLVC